ncbi:MAG: hypothetical protein IKC13_01805 [Elusimicrobiaceae bacterium]|nr:hypothetical protein [Elusimicrobiaceae bacterium]
MKKLFAICLALSAACASFAQKQEIIDFDAIKELAKEVSYSANAIDSYIDVSYKVETDFDVYDILDKNGNHLCLAYMVQGKEVDDTNWDLDTATIVDNVILQECDNYTQNIVNENHLDKYGNRRDVLRNYNFRVKGCTMYLIDDNWLMGSVECIGTEKTGAVGYPNYILANTPYQISKRQVTGDMFFNHKKDKKAPAKGRIFQGPNFVLVNIADTPAQAMMAGKPKANVMFFRNNLFNLLANGRLSGSFKVRTHRFNMNTTRTRALQIGSYKNGTFSLQEGATDLTTTGGDPLFYKAGAGQEFLVGFNAGRIVNNDPELSDASLAIYSGEVVNRFRDFHENDYKFVKETLSKTGDWERVKEHMFLI